MKRILLSLFLVFGLTGIANAENETVTLQVTTGVMECVDAADIGCFGTSFAFDDLVTFELVKDEENSGEQFDLYSAKWEKEFNQDGFTFRSSITLSKTVMKAETDPEIPTTIYSIMYQTGFTPESAVASITMKRTISEDVFAQLVVGGSTVKDGKIYRPSLGIWNMPEEGENDTQKAQMKSILKSITK